MQSQAKKKRVVIVGGGAAGFFGAIRLAELAPEVEIVILEKSQHLLAKVSVSGGGRCNVTHACFDPKVLSGYYPRGGRSLIGPFTRFQPRDTIEWFEQRGVTLKTESDGRMFPVTDQSSTIVNCFLDEASLHRIAIRKGVGLVGLERKNDFWQLDLSDKLKLDADAILFASGSSDSIWTILNGLGVAIIDPLPSLFTFQVRDERIAELAGLAFEEAEVSMQHTKFKQNGPVLITHKGFSGPAILRLSAWAAREMAAVHYQFEVKLNLVGLNQEACFETLVQFKKENERKSVYNAFPWQQIPRRYRERIFSLLVIQGNVKWADLSNVLLRKMAGEFTNAVFAVTGKNTFKEEFVTCGGVSLDAINLQTMESKQLKGIYFAGECMNVDAITGGFNFQHAWTSSWIAASAIAEQLKSLNGDSGL